MSKGFMIWFDWISDNAFKNLVQNSYLRIISLCYILMYLLQNELPLLECPLWNKQVIMFLERQYCPLRFVWKYILVQVAKFQIVFFMYFFGLFVALLIVQLTQDPGPLQSLSKWVGDLPTEPNSAPISNYFKE